MFNEDRGFNTANSYNRVRQTMLVRIKMNQNFDPKKTNTVVLQRGVKVLPYHDKLLCENLHKTSSFYPERRERISSHTANALQCCVMCCAKIYQYFQNIHKYNCRGPCGWQESSLQCEFFSEANYYSVVNTISDMLPYN